MTSSQGQQRGEIDTGGITQFLDCLSSACESSELADQDVRNYPKRSLLRSRNIFRAFTNIPTKGPLDKLTSVVIPLALATTCGFMIARGIYNMSHGIGKKE